MKSFSGDIGKKCRSAVPASSRLTAQTDGKGISRDLHTLLQRASTG